MVEQLEGRVDRIQQLKTNVERLHQKQTDVVEKSTLVQQKYAHHDTSAADFDPDRTFADGRVHRIAGQKMQMLGEMPAHGQDMAGNQDGDVAQQKQDGGKNKAQSGGKKAWYSRPITPGTLRVIVRDQIVQMVAPILGGGAKKPQPQQQGHTVAQGHDASGAGGVSSVDSSALINDQNIGTIEKYVEQHLMTRKQAWLEREGGGEGGGEGGLGAAGKNASVDQNIMSAFASMRPNMASMHPNMGGLKSRFGHEDHDSGGVYHDGKDGLRMQTPEMDGVNDYDHSTAGGVSGGGHDDHNVHKAAEQLRSSKRAVDHGSNELQSIDEAVARSCLVFSRTNPLRLLCFYIYTSELWSIFFTGVALAYSIYLLILPELPPDVYTPLSASQITGPRTFLWADIFDIVSAFVLLVETFVGVVALGFIIGPNTYMRISGFHMFDLIVLVVTIWDYIASYALGVRGASLRAFRMLRVFRVLVRIKPLGSMKRIMRALQFGMFVCVCVCVCLCV